MEKPKILWIDLRLRRGDIQLPTPFEERCEIKLIGSDQANSQANRLGESFLPDALCFDFDYPDLSGLKLLQETKKARASLPLIMLTEQHSEALAVWAFRNRVWDYLVRPVADSEASRAVETLVELKAYSTERRQRHQIPTPPIPREARFRNDVPNDDNIELAKNYVQNNLGGKIQERVVARHCSMSPFRFSRAFKKETGITFQEYIIQARVKEACRLMDNPSVSISDVAYTVGFNDPSYFARIFKRYMGRPPSEYREAEMHGQPDDSGLWARLELPEGSTRQ